MILERVKPTIQPLGVEYVNRPKHVGGGGRYMYTTGLSGQNLKICCGIMASKNDDFIRALNQSPVKKKESTEPSKVHGRSAEHQQ